MSGRRNIEDIYPLSPLQQGLLAESLGQAGGGAYQQQVACRLDGDVDPAAFAAAWQRLVERHSILRSGFFWKRRDDPFQVVFRRVGVDPVQHDWRGLDAAEGERRVAALAAEERRRPFDLGRPPLLRIALIRLGERDHRLVWTYHHLLLDGWSVGRVLDDLFTLYAAASEGRVAALPTPRPYGDFIAWLGRRDAAAAERFWRHELAGFSAPTPLGIDTPVYLDGAPGACRRVLAADLSSRLDELARRQRVTRATLVRAAWARLLALYSGCRDVVFGVTVAGRPADLVGAEAMIGPFINTVPVRVRVEPSRELGPWLERLHEQQAAMSEHEHASLVSVHGWSDVPRGQALFASLLLFQNYLRGDGAGNDRDGAAAAGRFGGLRVSAVESQESTHYPLTLVAAAGDRLSLKVAFDGRRVGEDAAELVLDHLEELLAGFADAPRARLGELRPAADAAAIDAGTAASLACGPLPAPTLDRLLARRAAMAPHAIAAAYPDGHLTYGELDRRANRLAHHLRHLGAGAEERVAVALGRGVDLPVALLAVLKSGAAYLPLDPSYPPQRLALMLDDAGARLLISDAAHRGRLPEHGLETVLVDRDAQVIGAQPATPPAPEGDPERLAYVLYTSGSTGRPKGTLVRHGSLVRHASELGRLYRLAPGGRILHFFSPSFDASAEDLYPALAAGATVVGVGEPAHLAPRELAAQVERHALTHLHLPASHWRRLVDALAAVGTGSALPALQVLSFGGEAVHGEALRRWHRATAGRTLCLDVYGPTEATVTSAVCELEAAEQAVLDGAVPIGRAIGGTTCRVVDTDLAPLPRGIAGELVIGGEGVARGYLGRPAQTAERFVPDPVGAAPGARLYRTGDRARRQADGRLAFLGRLDAQLKLRGFRIEPGEVEAALELHPAVRQAVVAVRGERLVAYRVHAAGDGVPDDTLHAFAARRLPPHMLPDVHRVLDVLPLNANGKVDRAALPDAPGGTAEVAAAGPGDPTEEILAGIWSRVLERGPIGPDSDFFALGGHSLLAVRAVARIEETFAVSLPLRELFEHPTPAALAPRVEAARGGAGAPPLLPAEAGDGTPRAVSFAQRRLWFLDQLEPDSTAYVVAKGVYLDGPLDPGALARAVSEVVRRHAVLRTRFPARDGDPVQVAEPPRPVALPRVDLSCLDGAIAVRAVGAAVAAFGGRPYDLAAGELLRLALLRMSPHRHALALAVHHIVADGRSMELLLRELSRLYAAFAAGLPSPLPDLAVQYADYAEWQRGWLSGEALEEHLGYWRRRLGGRLPVLRLGPRRTPGRPPGDRGGSFPFRLPTALGTDLDRLGREVGVTRFMTLLAAFQALLYRTTGEGDVLVGADVSGRSRRETEGLIGFFINMLVLRTEVAGDATFRALLQRVRETALGAYAHRELPFERLVEEVQPERDGSHSPIFQVVFNYEPRIADEEVVGGGLGAVAAGDETAGDRGTTEPALRLRPVDAGERPVRFDLTLGITDGGDDLRGAWMYRRELFAESDVARLHDRFERLLTGAVTNPDCDLDSLPLADRHEIEERQDRDARRRRSARDRLQDVRPEAVPVMVGGGDDRDENPEQRAAARGSEVDP